MSLTTFDLTSIQSSLEVWEKSKNLREQGINIDINFTHGVRGEESKPMGGKDYPFFCPSAKASAYISSRPQYKPLPQTTYEIPDNGNYQLPLKLFGFQYLYLNELFKATISRDNVTHLMPNFFPSLPGVKAVNFDVLSFIPPGKDFGMGARSFVVATKNGESHTFLPSKDIQFENTVTGAVTAFIVMACLNRHISWWHAYYGADHDCFIFHSWVPKEEGKESPDTRKEIYAAPFSSQNSLPYGFRLEIQSKRVYTVSALAESRTSGLIDLSLEIKDGLAQRLDYTVLQNPVVKILY